MNKVFYTSNFIKAAKPLCKKFSSLKEDIRLLEEKLK
jgi:hypothetical protein